MHTRSILLSLLPSALAGCLLTPDGLDSERDRAALAGGAWTRPIAERELPELAPAPDLPALLERAFLANGELESAWHEWRASLAQVAVESAWPEGSFEFEVERAFHGGRSGFDQTRMVLGFEPMLMLPAKASARGRVALASARAAAERFRAQALALRTRVLVAASRLALLDATLAVEAQEAELLALMARSASQALGTGGEQRPLLRLQIEARLVDDRRARTAAARDEQRTRLNGLLARAPDAPLSITFDQVPPRALAASDAELLVRASERNPELALLAREVEGRGEMLELARLRYWPDFSPRIGFVGSLEQFVAASIMLPANLPAIRAGIREARGSLAAAEARARQAGADTAAGVVAELALLRDAERASALYRDEIVPLAQRLAASARSSYATGSLSQLEWIDSQRAELDARLAGFEARAAREMSLARIEELSGIGIENAVPQVEVAHE